MILYNFLNCITYLCFKVLEVLPFCYHDYAQGIHYFTGIIYFIHTNFCCKSKQWRSFWIFRSIFLFQSVYFVFILCPWWPNTHACSPWKYPSFISFNVGHQIIPFNILWDLVEVEIMGNFRSCGELPFSSEGQDSTHTKFGGQTKWDEAVTFKLSWQCTTVRNIFYTMNSLNLFKVGAATNSIVLF